jgi:hypothetical protein
MLDSPMSRARPRSCASAAALLAHAFVAYDAFGAEDDSESMRVRPCRPTVSCSADLVPPGALEIEMGYAARRARPGGFIHAEPLLVKLTLVRWLQLQVGWNTYVFTTGDVSRSLRYYDDLSFGAKAHFVDQAGALPSLSASAALSIPSFDPAIDFPFAYDASFWLYASKDAGPLHFDLNCGLNVWEFDLPQRSVQVFGALATSAPIASDFGAMAEMYIFSDAGRIAPIDSGLLLATSYSPAPRVLFDAGVDVSFEPATRFYTLFAGVTFVPARLWGDARPTTTRTRRSLRYASP